MVYDSGQVFAYPGAYAVDEDDRPYLAFRTGVLDWNKGGPDQVFRASAESLNAHAKPVVALTEHYTTWRDGLWDTRNSIPSSWPRVVINLLTGPGEASWRLTATRGIVLDDQDPSFLFFRRHPLPTALYLFHCKRGYATQLTGAVELP